MSKILITGCAGFIGFSTARKLLQKRNKIVGVDNLNNYYNKNFKNLRIQILKKNKNFFFYKIDINNFNELIKISKKHKFNKIIHLAAQPGVQYSFKNPKSYLKNNIDGFLNILELAKKIKCKHLLFGSSSSVYGLNNKFPFKESQNVDHPISIYSMTKRSNELMAHSYSYNFKIPITGLRFFTVYGPYGRPDMSVLKFINNIYNKKKIPIYNFGNNRRDFTFIDDIVNRIVSLLNKVPKSSKNTKNNKPNSFSSCIRLLNIGTSNTISINRLIFLIETNLGIKSKKIFYPKLKGDVEKTLADNSNIKKIVNKSKFTPYKIGIKKTVEWYLSFKKKL